MTIQYLKSKSVSGADWLGLVTRDCPNDIVPTATAAITRNPGDAWAWSVYAQVDPGLAYDFLLRQLIMCTGIGVDLTTNGGLSLYREQQVEIATGAAGSEVVVADAQLVESVVANMSGNTDGTTTCFVASTTTRDIPLFPVVIPSSTRIALRSTLDIAATRKYSRYYLSGYDLSSLTFDDYAAYTKAFELGSVGCYSAVIPLGSNISVVGNATPITFGAYSTVIDPLDYDCLVTMGICVPNTSTSTSVQFDVAIGAAGSEVVQARYAYGAPGLYRGSCHVRFPFPFIAYAGERLAVRLMAMAGISNNYQVGLSGIKLL